MDQCYPLDVHTYLLPQKTKYVTINAEVQPKYIVATSKTDIQYFLQKFKSRIGAWHKKGFKNTIDFKDVFELKYFKKKRKMNCLFVSIPILWCLILDGNLAQLNKFSLL